MQTPLHFETTTKLHSTSSTTSISAHRTHEKRKKNNVLTKHMSNTSSLRESGPSTSKTIKPASHGIHKEKKYTYIENKKNKRERKRESKHRQEVTQIYTHSHDMENMNPKAMALLTPRAHRLQSDHSKEANSQSSDTANSHCKLTELAHWGDVEEQGATRQGGKKKTRNEETLGETN